jgi:heat shock protein HslJ
VGCTLALIAVLIAAIAVPSSIAAVKKSHKIDGTVTARDLTGNIVTGTVKGKLGSGAVVYVVTSGPNGTQNLDITSFQSKGAFKAKANVTLGTQPDGTTTVTGSGTINGGSGAYKGAKGKFTTTGTISSDGLITAKIAGSAKY